MNDRLKFRVWNKHINEYCNIQNLFILPTGETGYFITDGSYPHQRKFMHQEDMIIEMCTGLKDKNGNLIYEGDILLCERKIVDCATGAEIHYKSSGMVQREKNGQYFINGKDWYGSDITFYNECAEIIGNIHEQAEQKDK